MKEEATRGLLRRLFLEVVQRDEATVKATIRRLLKDPRTAVHALELAAKLNGEIGRDAELPKDRPVRINVITNVDLKKLRGAARGRLPSGPADLALGPPQTDWQDPR